VLASRVTLTVPLEKLPAGKHTLKIYAVDPGVVVDQFDVPE
jgi:Gylcosyl hydrolase family 115 C-terminal domain